MLRSNASRIMVTWGLTTPSPNRTTDKTGNDTAITLASGNRFRISEVCDEFTDNRKCDEFCRQQEVAMSFETTDVCDEFLRRQMFAMSFVLLKFY